MIQGDASSTAIRLRPTPSQKRDYLNLALGENKHGRSPEGDAESKGLRDSLSLPDASVSPMNRSRIYRFG